MGKKYLVEEYEEPKKPDGCLNTIGNIIVFLVVLFLAAKCLGN